MAEIFISYARPDRDYARRLASYLEDAELSVWWDMNLEPGQVFREEIERRIGEARHVIVLWSETSVKSLFVLDEAGDAARQNKLVPVRIDGCKLPYRFGQHHTHTVSVWPGDLAKVLAAVAGGKMRTEPAPAPAKMSQDFFIDSGLAAFHAGDFGRAITDCNEVIRLRPDDAAAYCFRGLAYKNEGDNDRAIADYNEAIRLNPDFEIAYGFRASAYSRKGDYARAIRDYDQAIRLNPNRAHYHSDRAAAYVKKGDPGRAIADLSEAIRLKLDFADAYKLRGLVYYSQRDYARAISDFDQVLRIDPDYKDAADYKTLAEAKKKKGRF